MRTGVLLVALFFVIKLRYGQSRCYEQDARTSSSEQTVDRLDNLKRNILKRYSDLDYDSFVGLMGRRSAESSPVQSPNKREMQDIFVGLMGKRNSDPDNGPWRRESPERRGIFLNKCRLRFLQGL
uniref:Tachykinin precursor 3a n=1 Tax=Neogobius melanostomus TaxID=47308 RepID=A0A8C6SXV5_9GOBI